MKEIKKQKERELVFYIFYIFENKKTFSMMINIYNVNGFHHFKIECSS